MEECDQYFELLELDPDASLDAIRRRYRYLKTLYGSDSIEIRALNGECYDEVRADYLERLDRAFAVLNSLTSKNKAVAAAPPGRCQDDEHLRWVGQLGCLDGPSLRAVRERLQIDLKTIFSSTRIQPHLLEALEAEDFNSFTAEVYLRSYLIEYSRSLGLDSSKVLNDYLPRYRQWLAARKGC